jgi:hypothetical protein
LKFEKYGLANAEKMIPPKPNASGSQVTAAS